MDWLILALAGTFLGGAIISLRYADPAVRRYPFLLAFLSLTISVGLFGIAPGPMPMVLAVAVWLSIGIFSAVFAGVVLFRESPTTLPLAVIALLFLLLTGFQLSPGAGSQVADVAKHQSIIRTVALAGPETVRF
jgi:multidrug transporter EmrE-like cation transporter